MTNIDKSNNKDIEILIDDVVKDKSGTLYRITGSCSSRSLRLHVDTPTMVFGRVNGVVFNNTNQLTIGDIYISEYIAKPPLWKRIFPFLTWNIPNYRGNGLGSAMLKFTVQQAKLMGVDSIVGNISAEDLEATPYLRKFYEKHGFVIDDRMNIRLDL